jgi:hypothetical protein
VLERTYETSPVDVVYLGPSLLRRFLLLRNAFDR